MSRSEILRTARCELLLVAEVISTTGAQMTWLALPWFVLTTTGSPARMTLVVLAELLGPPDCRHSGRERSCSTRRPPLDADRDAVRAPLMLLVPVLHWTGRLRSARCCSWPRYSELCGPVLHGAEGDRPGVVGEDERVVSQANALFQGAVRLTLLLGPPLAGVLIGVIGAANVLVVDGVTYLVSFALVAAFVPRASSCSRRRGGGLGRHPRGSGFASCSASRCSGPGPALRRRRRGLAGVLRRRSGTDDRAVRANARIAGALFAAFGAGALLGNSLRSGWLARSAWRACG